jgi:hypothetical protein
VHPVLISGFHLRNCASVILAVVSIFEQVSPEMVV